jgi:RNA polymerase sigma factor (TIGR02999 family)
MKPRVTELLLLWNRGNRDALDQLIPLVHAELLKLARGYMSHEKAHTLEPTALVNEAYLRLVDMPRVGWTDRAHFFAVAARLMRHILVDLARAKNAQKRGGGARVVSITTAIDKAQVPAYDVIGLNRALDKMSTFDTRRAQVIELRIFGGLTVEETAAALAISTDTVTRDWKLAKAWLARELGGTSNAGPS